MLESANMAPQLELAQRSLVKTLLINRFPSRVIAKNARCSVRAVQRIRLEHDTAMMPTPKKSPRGRRSCITSAMQEALCEALTERPDMYRSDMVDFLREKFGRKVSERSIGRMFRSVGWTRTKMRRIAQQRDDDRRDQYLHDISEYKSYHFVFIDESGCDGRDVFRRWGWSPKGTSPVQVARFSRGNRWHILPAYTQNGVLMRWVYQGSTDTALFEGFIELLLHHCGRFPEPNSVLVMDNASWHGSERIQTMCSEAGVRVVFLPPYSPDFNSIEQYFGVLKAFIKKHRHGNEHFIKLMFKEYLEWCVDVVGDNVNSAQGHFRHAGIPITQPPKE